MGAASCSVASCKDCSHAPTLKHLESKSTLLRAATSHLLGTHDFNDSELEDEDAEGATARSRRIFGRGVKEFKGLPSPRNQQSPSGGSASSSRGQGGSPLTSARSGSADEEARKRLDNFFQAARSGNVKRLKELVRQGLSVHSTTLRGQTPLMLAAASHTRTTLDAVSFLLESKSNLEAADHNGWTALLHACRNSEREIVQCLLKSDANLNARASDGKTAVMLAAMDGGDQVVADLVARKAALDCEDHLGWSVLFYACADGRFELVKWLLKRQASVKDKARDGTTALMVVAEQGSRKIGKQLLKKSAQLNARNSHGNTALMLSLKAGNEEFADWLLSEGVDVTIKNEEEEDAMEIADFKNMNTMKSKIEMKARVVVDDKAHQGGGHHGGHGGHSSSHGSHG